MSLNKVTLIGNLGADPETRYTRSGDDVTNFRIATNERWTRNGEMQERTEWHRIVTFGNLAKTCGKYLSKGRQVYVEGRLQTRKWTDRNGNDRYATEIVARSVQFLGGNRDAPPEKPQAHEDPAVSTAPQTDCDDVPFD